MLLFLQLYLTDEWFKLGSLGFPVVKGICGGHDPHIFCLSRKFPESQKKWRRYWCASLTGKVQKVKVPFIQGQANRSDPNSCVWMSNYPGEALIGESVGQVLSCEIRQILQRADVVSTYGRQHSDRRQARRAGSLRSQRPCTCTEASCAGTGRAHVRPEKEKGKQGCIGKSKDVSQ
jgi:hypothetical protein